MQMKDELVKCDGRYNDSLIIYNEHLFPSYPAPVGNRTKSSSQLSSLQPPPPPPLLPLPSLSLDGYKTKQSIKPSDSHTSVKSKQTLKLDLIPDDVRTSPSASNNNHTNISNYNNNRNHQSKPHHQPKITKKQIITKMSSVTTTNINQHNTISSTGYHIGLYGWRKRCLFILILGLMVLIIVNLALTLWILKVMEFSSEGMGQLKVVAGGLQLSGQTLILDLLRASTIRSRYGHPISLESSRNFSINTRDWEGRIENNLFLGHDKLEVLAHSFKIIDPGGAIIFAADKNEVAIGAYSLRIDGEGGAIFRESIQTPVIKAEPGKELRFDSPTRSLQISAGQDIFMKSAAGSLDVNCLNDIRLHSEAGAIRLDSGNIMLPNLKTAIPPSITGSSQSHDHIHKVYQLCACGNGKLFLALSHSVCAGDESIICR